MTAETITDPRLLALTLAKVRTSGLAAEAEEAVIGECGLAAPLADATGLAGAIGLVTPISGWPLPDTALDALRDTARAVSRELGATAWPPTVAEAVSA
jgi:DNA-binding IclR family transcriptional regulator